MKTKALLQPLFALITALLLTSCGSSPQGTVRSFLNASIANADTRTFLADGVNASYITGHEVLSYEVKNTTDEVVSVLVNFKGTRRQYNRAFGENIDIPETVRFRVKGGKITEIY